MSHLGYGRSAFSISTLASTTFAATVDAQAALAACGRMAFDRQDPSDRPQVEIFESTALNAWVCLMYAELGPDGLDHFGTDGASEDVGCYYAMHEDIWTESIILS